MKLLDKYLFTSEGRAKVVRACEIFVMVVGPLMIAVLLVAIFFK
jgi:hypothetical protein